MADRVERILERDLQSLDDLQRLELVTPVELRQLIDRRRALEYKLQRRAPILDDFLRAIQFEVNLASLITERLARTQTESSASTSCVVTLQKRTFGLFERALQKFPQDVAMWHSFLDYAREIGSSKSLSIAFSRALQLHPNKPDLWIKTMSWEFDVQNNIEGARVIMQRGLRMNPVSSDLWLAFFQMELIYIRRLTERQRRIKAATHGAESTSVNEEADPRQEFLKAAPVAKLIFERAIAAVPDADGQFRRAFLDKIGIHRDDHPELVDTIIESLSTGPLKSHPDCLTFCADFRSSCEPFETALSLLDADRAVLYAAYVEWLFNMEQFIDAVAICKRAINDKCSSPSLFVRWMEMSLGDLTEENRLFSLAIKHFPSSALIWEFQAAVSIRQAALSSTSCIAFFEKAVRACGSLSSQIWLEFVRYALSIGKDCDTIFFRSLESLTEESHLLNVQFAAIELMDLQGVRRVLNAARTMPIELFMRGVLRLLEEGQQVGLRELLEIGIDRWGSTSADLWRLVIEVETARGGSQAASKAQWRARQTMADPTQLDIMLSSNITLSA